MSGASADEGRFRAVEELFQEARRLPPGPRAARLAAADPGLAAEVEALLVEHAGGAPFLETPALGGGLLGGADAPGGVGLPERVGPYRVLERIGEGGMGAVYLAEQDRPRRIVALKVIRPGWATPSMRRRFQLEAEVLGRLRHPGIAQVYGAGLDDAAGELPYIAMEYVAGLPLLEHVAKAQPDLSARLTLFAGICDAVEHAHCKGVIHRDLKPGNILVETGDGVARPKVLDFGIARVTDADVALTTLGTGAGQLVGTLQYMSPEQASGDPARLDTRSDVYSLGVILFELLTGRLPYELGQGTVHDAVGVILHEDPKTLSSIDGRLAGDLQTIVAKALEKEKQRRYPSAGALGADVRRYLADEPILAHPPSTLYQLRKFARRNRVLVGGLAAVLLALLAGLATTTWQWREATAQRDLAERRFVELRHLAESFIGEFDDAIKHVAGTLNARRLIVTRGLEYLDRLAAEARDDRILQSTLMKGYSRIGDIQGAPRQPNLGDLDGALASYRRALAINAARLEQRADDLPALDDQAMLLARVGDVLAAMNRPEEALDQYLRSRAAWERRQSGTPPDEREPVPLRGRVAGALASLGRPREAEAEDRAGLADARAWAERHPDDDKARRDLAVALMKVAMVEERAGRDDASLALYAEFLTRVTELREGQPHSAVLVRDLAAGHSRRRDVLLRLDRADEARADHAVALRLYRELVDADPDDAQALLDLSTVINKSGEMSLIDGRRDEARGLFEQVDDIAHRLVALDPDNSAFQRRRGVALFKMGEVHAAWGDDASLAPEVRRAHWAESRRWFTECREQFAGMLERGLMWPSDIEADVLGEIEGQIARGDAALAALGPAAPSAGSAAPP